MEDREAALATLDPQSSILAPDPYPCHPRLELFGFVIRCALPVSSRKQTNGWPCVHGMAGWPLKSAGSAKVSFL
jgi:hypothetical protein